jgi:hypothetical protein
VSGRNQRSESSGIKPIETLYRGYRFRSRLEARWAVFFDTARIPWRYEQEGFDLSDVELPNEPGVLEQMRMRTPEDREAVNKKDTPKWYLPDFYLPRQECWVEIKAREPSRKEGELMAHLAWGTGQSGYIFWDLRAPKEIQGSTPKEVIRSTFQSAIGFHVIQDPREPYIDRTWMEWTVQSFALNIDPEDEDPGPVVEGDFDHQWCECPRCGLLGITLFGNARLLKCGCLVESSTQQARLSYIDPDPVYTDDSPRLMAAYMAARQARFEHGEHPQQYILQSKLDRIREVLDSDENA